MKASLSDTDKIGVSGQRHENSISSLIGCHLTGKTCPQYDL